MTSIQKWYTTHLPQEELDRLISTTCLGEALSILKQHAKVPPVKSNDLTAIALAHAQLAGYQKAIDDLIALSAPRNRKQLAPLPTEWSYLNPDT
jgi:regulator of sirC expression with transglutaminase-like and TPR domain